MKGITGESHSNRTKIKECLPRQITTGDLDTTRQDFSGCNSAEECLLPKQDVEGSNPFTRSTYQRFAKGDLALQIITDEGKPLWKPLP